ncbi:MAG: hypothetical protein WC760_04915 [Bacteroidia bacterium]|jgi:hypothetical protein
MNKGNRFSLLALLLVASFVILYRGTHIQKEEISWDVLGYHMYLPATLLHHDPLLKDISWFEKARTERQLAGTAYMISTNQNGQPMYFFLMGMSLFYLPFFLLARLYDLLFGLAADPYSWHDQVILSAGFILITLVGLIYLRKILLQFYSDRITAIVLLVMLFATNCIHHLTIKNLETVNVLFTLGTLVMWNTIRWHQNRGSVYLYGMALCMMLMLLVKPSEFTIVLIPLFWNVTGFAALKIKLKGLISDRKTWAWIAITAVILFFPQLYYWHRMTGKWIHDSYINPGIGLDFLSPHIFNVLFSFRKGWLIYTPIMGIALLGFIPLYRQYRNLFWACLLYFLSSFYIIASWTEWWYGAAFSIRPLIVTYPVLALSMGAFLQWIGQQRRWLTYSTGLVMILFTSLNLFQYWQYRHWMIDPYRTTWPYYKAIFLRTSFAGEVEQLKLIKRDFTGKMVWENKALYVSKQMPEDWYCLNNTSGLKRSESGMEFSGDEFSEILRQPFKNVTNQDHCWVESDFEYCLLDTPGTPVYLVLSMQRPKGQYGYTFTQLKPDVVESEDNWQKFHFEYLTPEIRDGKDELKIYFWNTGGAKFKIRKANFNYWEMKQENE